LIGNIDPKLIRTDHDDNMHHFSQDMLESGGRNNRYYIHTTSLSNNAVDFGAVSPNPGFRHLTPFHDLTVLVAPPFLSNYYQSFWRHPN